jgi:CheY-like chemotaxis protein
VESITPLGKTMEQTAKRTVLVATSDLFIQSRVAELASSLGLEARFATDERELTQLAGFHPRLVIVDLASSDYNSALLIRKLKTKSPRVRIMGYFPHIRRELEESARSAGADFVVPNSSFIKTLKQLLETDPR